MKNTQSIISISRYSILICALLFSSSMMAEDVKPKAGNKKAPMDRFEMMATKLKLDDKQKAELKPMLESLKKERASTLKALDENETKKLSSILKPEQVNQAKRLLKQGHRNKMRKNGMKKEGKRKPMHGQYPKPPAKLPKQQ